MRLLLPLLFLALAALACSVSGRGDSGLLVITAPPDGTAEPTRIAGGGIPLTNTPTVTPSLTSTFTPTPTFTLTPTLTPTPTMTFTPTSTPTVTPPVMTLTPVPTGEAVQLPAASVEAALQPTAGWSCGDFPCEDDVEGFLQRISVPEGFTVSHVGRLPGQPRSIVYGPDGRLYAVVITDGAQAGAIVAYDEATGESETLADGLIAPGGLAFRPGTDIIYFTARTEETRTTPTRTPENAGGALYSLQPGDPPRLLRQDLPCCFTIITGQPNDITFGPDGYLYLTAGAVTDHSNPDPNLSELLATPTRLEGTVLRISPDGSEMSVVGNGFHDPIDLTFTADGSLFVTDTGLIYGMGDRLVRVEEGGNHSWPYWRERGCSDCPLKPSDLTPVPDWVLMPREARPRGLTAYHGDQFPAEYYDNLFVALWNGTEGAQRILRVENRANGTVHTSAFMTGLIRPADVVVAPDGTLVVADFIYGNVWRVTADES